jgi:hypothetical protein
VDDAVASVLGQSYQDCEPIIVNEVGGFRHQRAAGQLRPAQDARF